MNYFPRAPHPLDRPNAYPEPIGPIERIGQMATAQGFKTQYPNPEQFSTAQKPAPHWEEGRFAEKNAESEAEVRRINREADAKIAKGLYLKPNEYKVAYRSPMGITYTYKTPAEKIKEVEQAAVHRG